MLPLGAIHYAPISGICAAPMKGMRGLDFPGPCLDPVDDFTYFAAVLSATFQVSDVAITGRHMHNRLQRSSTG
jgi:uncharacterized membrane protein